MNYRIGFLLAFLMCFVCAGEFSAQEITKKRGKYRIYYASGKVKAKGKVKNYHKNGEWKYFDEEGRVTAIAHYIMDTIDGQYTEYSSTSFPTVQGTYCKNRKCGNWKMYDSQGNQISEENFANGVQDGTQRFWYPNGHLRDSLQFYKGVIQYRKAWYDNGQAKAIETYKDGLAEGKWVVYKDPARFRDTFPEYTDEYHLGKKHGWHYLWNGTSLIEAYHYQDGLPDGTFTRYAYDGKPVLIQNYSMGKLNGKTTFFKDGLKLKEENYLDDRKEGEHMEYDRNEKVSVRSWYEQGDIDSSYSYHSNGRVAIRRVYGGMLGTTPYKEWDSSGVLIMTGMMYGELRDGEWTTYYPNGKVRSTTNYQQGKIVGLYTKYYPNGKKMIQYTFLPIGTNTMPDVWDQKGKLLKKGTKEYEEIVEGNRPGEIISDPSEYNRSIIDHRIHETASVDEHESGEFFLMEVDEALAIAEQDRLKNPDDSGEVYSFCEIMPEFPGGEKARQDFIHKNSLYPGEAHDKSGTVYVRYVVEVDGTVTNVELMKGVQGAPSLDDEALRLVSTFPPQVSAKMNGRPARCYVTIPIRFEPYK